MLTNMLRSPELTTGSSWRQPLLCRWRLRRKPPPIASEWGERARDDGASGTATRRRVRDRGRPHPHAGGAPFAVSRRRRPCAPPRVEVVGWSRAEGTGDETAARARGWWLRAELVGRRNAGGATDRAGGLGCHWLREVETRGPPLSRGVRGPRLSVGEIRP